MLVNKSYLMNQANLFHDYYDFNNSIENLTSIIVEIKSNIDQFFESDIDFISIIEYMLFNQRILFVFD